MSLLRHAPVCARAVLQARQFGVSPFLQVTDYNAAATITGFASRYELTETSLIMSLKPNTLAALSPTHGNQFRGRLSVKTFSNRNGERCVPATWRAPPLRCRLSLPPPLWRVPSHVCRRRVYAMLSGAFRQPIGSDMLKFHPATGEPEKRPRLLLLVSGRAPPLLPPVPSPEYPRGPIGHIIGGSTKSVEATCNGGARRLSVRV